MAFHPQMDGHSEVTIRVLENFPRPYIECNPHTWVQQLPLVEFAVNHTVSISIESTLFYLNKGFHPTIAMKEMLGRIKTALAEAQTNLERAQRRMANMVNRSRR